MKSNVSHATDACRGRTRAYIERNVFAYLTENAEWQGDCLVWIRNLTDRYPRYSSKRLSVAKLAWRWFHGRRWPGEKWACHTCDNTRCVNPQHIYPGDRYTNAKDAMRRGRHVCQNRNGEKHPRASLTNQQAAEIRDRLSRGELQADLAAEFGVCQPTISNIRRGCCYV